jgi:hypothetical protein
LRPDWDTIFQLKDSHYLNREEIVIGRSSIFVAATVTLAVAASSAAFAQYTDGVVKIGVLTDMSSVYADVTGPGSVTAARLAIEDFGGAAKGGLYLQITKINRT